MVQVSFDHHRNGFWFFPSLSGLTEGHGLAGAGAGEFGFELLRFARFEEKSPALGFAYDSFAQNLPLEAAHCLLNRLSGIKCYFCQSCLLQMSVTNLESVVRGCCPAAHPPQGRANTSAKGADTSLDGGCESTRRRRRRLFVPFDGLAQPLFKTDFRPETKFALGAPGVQTSARLAVRL